MFGYLNHFEMLAINKMAGRIVRYMLVQTHQKTLIYLLDLPWSRYQ